MAQIYNTDSHDVIIDKLADLMEKNNPGKYKIETHADDDDQPDIILKDSKDGKGVLAIEVETVESLTEDRITSCWTKSLKNYPALQAVIPKGTSARANRICKRAKIKVRFQEY